MDSNRCPWTSMDTHTNTPQKDSLVELDVLMFLCVNRQRYALSSNVLGRLRKELGCFMDELSQFQTMDPFCRSCKLREVLSLSHANGDGNHLPVV